MKHKTIKVYIYIHSLSISHIQFIYIYMCIYEYIFICIYVSHAYIYCKRHESLHKASAAAYLLPTTHCNTVQRTTTHYNTHCHTRGLLPSNVCLLVCLHVILPPNTPERYHVYTQNETITLSEHVLLPRGFCLYTCIHTKETNVSCARHPKVIYVTYKERHMPGFVWRCVCLHAC